MKLIIDIPEEAYKQIMEFGFLENTHGKICYKAIKNGTPIPDNATFGDVIEKITNRKPLEDNKDADNIIISTKLWNAPYQKGGKE
jgi:hypothetical protein